MEYPSSNESEMVVLGTMMSNPEALKVGADRLEDSDFCSTQNRTIFQVMKEAYRANKPVDVHLVCEALKQSDRLVVAGGIPYVVNLDGCAGTSAYVEAYCDELKAFSIKRNLISQSQETIRRVIEGEEPVALALQTQEAFGSIAHSGIPKTRFRIQFLDQSDSNFLLEQPPKKPMLLEYTDEKGLVQGFLPKGIVAMLVGAGGVGKTHLLAQMAVSVASGTLFLDEFMTTEHCGKGNKGNVFLGFGENQYEDIHRVLYKASKKLRSRQPDIAKEDVLKEASKRIAPFSFCGQMAAFLQESLATRYFRELKMRLIDIVPPEGWTLIILDPVSRLLGADAETDNAAATQFIALLEELSQDLPGNPTVMFSHHVNKAALQPGTTATQSASRGSSALTDGVRWQCNLTKKTGTDHNIELKVIELVMTKSNFTAIPATSLDLIKDFEGFLEKMKDHENIVATKLGRR